MISQTLSRATRLFNSIQAFAHGGLRKSRSELLAKPIFNENHRVIPYPWENGMRTPRNANVKLAQNMQLNDVYLFSSHNKAIGLCKAIRALHGQGVATIRLQPSGKYKVGIRSKL